MDGRDTRSHKNSLPFVTSFSSQQVNRQACHEPGGPNIITKVALVKNATATYIFEDQSQKEYTKYVYTYIFPNRWTTICTYANIPSIIIINYRVKLKLSTRQRIGCARFQGCAEYVRGEFL